MEYIDLFKLLNNIENYDANEIVVDEKTIIKNFNFESKYRFILPGGAGNSDDFEYQTHISDEGYEPDVIQEMLNKKDSEIMENINFRYHLMLPRNVKKTKELVLMFHGFNEKYWNKYLPWAKYISDRTDKAILFFPIAFHMNRAPAVWSDKREMYGISEERKRRHPDIISSSLSNVAISTRLHNKPQRFIWSGLQTYYDVIELIEYIKSGKHPAIEADTSIDIVSYSIGTFLAQILMMTNESDYFGKSKLVSFCGGAVFNRLSPVSKFILDSEANVSLYSYVVEHLDSHMKRDEVLRHYLNGKLKEGKNFRSMLNYNILRKYREDRYREMSDRIYAISLTEDVVVPPYEIVNTLQGISRDIPIKVDILEYPYKYKHEDPFPAIESIKTEVTEQFERTFNLVCDFLNKK